MHSTRDISAVVCVRNSISSIESCLLSLRDADVGEVIVVDARSTDGSREVALRIADKVLEDPGAGLAIARNIGIQSASRKFVLNFGADNTCEKSSLECMLKTLTERGYTGVSSMTKIQTQRGYFSKAMQIYKSARFYPGDRAVIGTPTLFLRETLISNPYDPKMGFSDDGDLCDRLSAKGAKFCIAPCAVSEIGQETFQSIVTRWRMYGISDYQTFKKNARSWNIARRIQSLLYPLKNELIFPVTRLSIWEVIIVCPFLVLITSIRYWNWVRKSLQEI